MAATDAPATPTQPDPETATSINDFVVKTVKGGLSLSALNSTCSFCTHVAPASLLDERTSKNSSFVTHTKFAGETKTIKDITGDARVSLIVNGQ